MTDERRRAVLVGGLVLLLILYLHATDPAPRARRGYEVAAPIGALKTISTSQTVFREWDKDGNGVLDYGTLRQLSDANLVDPLLGSGEKQGYRFEVCPSATTPEFLWFAVANPVRPGTTRDRYFRTNHSGIIYYTGVQGRALALDDGGPECAIPTNMLPVGM
ncbi:MAG: hypothetical protein M9894_27810 [Planctomycetes bacterium]|nr:hypothetical protein [Planctomycetota bacterium]